MPVDESNQQHDFNVFQQFLRETFGIVLPADRLTQLRIRLEKLMQAERISHFQALADQLRVGANADLQAAVMDIITINETSWCRDTYPFDILKQIVLPEIHRRRPMEPLAIWSAACSSGQEPYSISMLIEDIQKMHPLYFVAGTSILATDISQHVLTQAQRGEYDDVVMGRGLPTAWKTNYFTQTEHHTWQIKPTIKKRVTFEQLNLLDSYETLGPFDVIFCRNVLVYFSTAAKNDILKKMHAALKPGGYLILGATEMLVGMTEYYRLMQCNPGIIYRAIESLHR